MLSKYIQYFLDENNLELGEEFTIVYENGSEVYKDNETFFFKNTPTYTNDILISKKDENFCPTILLGLLNGLYYVKKKPWQPEIGDVYFYVAVDEGRDSRKNFKTGLRIFNRRINMKKYKVELIETYAFCFEVEANNRVEAEEKAKEYVDKYQADKFFECATNRVFKIIPKT